MSCDHIGMGPDPTLEPILPIDRVNNVAGVRGDSLCGTAVFRVEINDIYVSVQSRSVEKGQGDSVLSLLR